MYKPITSIFVLMCCFFIMTTTVNAEAVPTLNIATTNPSEQTLQLELELKNNPGFLSYQLMLQYDSSKLKPVKVKNSVANGTLMYNLDTSYKNKSCIKFAFANTEVSNAEDALFTVIFDIVNPSDKEYAFSLISHQFFDNNVKTLLTKNGSAMQIEVTTPPPLGNEGIIMKTPTPHVPDKTSKPNLPGKTQKPTIIPSGSPASASTPASNTEALSSNKESMLNSTESPKPASEEPLNSEKPLSKPSNNSEAVEHVPSTSPTASADAKNESSNADTIRNHMPYLLLGIFILAFSTGILLKKHKLNRK